MSAAIEIQALLRFLTQDAKVPLAAALPKVGQLRTAQLNSAENISKATLADILAIFNDEKLSKQVVNAAKRVTNPKKRAQPGTSSASPAAKRLRAVDQESPTNLEAGLALPTTARAVEELATITIQTNRAPLVLAFAVISLKYTMPEQPMSSRLSLAQAVVSANSQSKAKSIGLVNEQTAEDEGWAQGQPKTRVLGREIAVMRRARHQPHEANNNASPATVAEDETSQSTHESFWGLDLEALRKSNGPLVAGKNSSTTLPIHSPQAARSYLLRAFSVVQSDPAAEGKNSESTTGTGKKKSAAAGTTAMKEEALAMLLKTIDLLCQSWASALTREELDRRAWSWYLHVRPEVAQGQAGWGQKGQVCLGDILNLQRMQ